MTLLVVGAQGQLARCLLQVGQFQGTSIVASDAPELDLLNATTIFHTIDRVAPDIVINTAAYTLTDKAEAEPELAYAINAEGAGLVAEACAGKNTPLIHISTDYVFGGAATGPYRESDPAAPLNVYGHSKLVGERRVAERCQRHIILRTAWIYSIFGSNFVKTMLRFAENSSEVRVVDDQMWEPHLRSSPCRRNSNDSSTNSDEPAQRLTVGNLPRGGKRRVHLVRFSAGSLQSVGTARGTDGTPASAISRTEYHNLAKRPSNSRLDCSKCARVFGVRLPDWRIGVADCVRDWSKTRLKNSICCGSASNVEGLRGRVASGGESFWASQIPI